MLSAIIHVSPAGPAPIGFSNAQGLPSYMFFTFKNQQNEPFPYLDIYNPQLVMRPFTRGGAYAYDIEVTDVSGGAAQLAVPASVMNDRYHLELYFRGGETNGPQTLVATGRTDFNAYGYAGGGSLAPAAYATGPAGPAGPAGGAGATGPTGAPGERGSRWYTGAGAPGTLPDTRVDGDMYLDETNGDVYRWSAAASTWMAFKGV